MDGSRRDPIDRDNAEVYRAWEANADFWDARMGEGNDFHRLLLLPSLERLLALRAGERVLEVACGNGQLARWMAARGATVVAVDLSDRMIHHARERLGGSGARVDFRVADSTDPIALEALGEDGYDAVVCNMALMDISTLDPLAQALPHLLREGGRFVASVLHPCFNASGTRKVAVETETEGQVVAIRGVQIHEYLTPRKRRGLAMEGQPEAQPYFERPLQTLLGPFFRAGMLLDALEEPAFTDPPSPTSAWYSWSSFSEIPPALVLRFVPVGPSSPRGSRRLPLRAENPGT